jgi:hypothetical protein
VCFAPSTVRQLFLLSHQLLLLQEALELFFSPEFLVRGEDAVSNSVSNVLSAQTSHISTAILERVEDTVANSVSGFLGARPTVALTERRSGKQYYAADEDKLAHLSLPVRCNFNPARSAQLREKGRYAARR